MESEYQRGGAAGSLPEYMGFPVLTDDVKKKILSKLPVKSLMRFKCVSRKWKSLVTADSLFITSHLQSQYDSKSSQFSLLKNSVYSPFRISLLRDESTVEEVDTSFIGTDCQKKLLLDHMTVCSNGLVCLLQIFKGSSRIILWNPATREFRNLPEPFDKDSVCDVTINSGFDPRNNDYKLVRTAQHGRSNEIVVHVFSLRSNSWREVEHPNPGMDYSCLPSSKVELNGVLYWVSLRKQGVMEFRHGILSFDLSEEKFQELDTPSTGRTKTELKRVVKWRGKSLAVIIVSLYTDELECWSMGNDSMACSSKQSWTKQWAVRVPFGGSWWGLGVWRDLLLVVRTVGRGGKEEEEELLSFDLPSGEERVVFSIDFGKQYSRCICTAKAFDYVESLVSVHPER